MLKLFKASLLSLSVIGLLSAPALAAGDQVSPPDYKWSFEGPFGTFDRGALQRGFQVYKQVCSACHAMEHLSYRNLADLGYSEAQIKAIAAEYQVTDGPNEEGEYFERPARPSDKFKAPFDNKEQAKAANGGAYPPDMSLIAKARPYGADYIKALLLGYEEPPEGKELQAGQYWNKYMSGHVIAMANPLNDGQISYPDGSPETAEQYAADVAHFLMWAAEPKLEVRKQTGVMVILFLIAFAFVMYLTKRKIWANIKK